MTFSIYALLTTALAASAALDTCSAQSPPPSPYKGDTSGCGKYHFPLINGITDKHTITSAGLSRSYNLHRPSNYDASKQYGLIVAYHGSGENGIEMELDTLLDAHTPNHIVAYPNGIGQTWAGANYSKATPSQDLIFTSDLVADIRRNYCIDSSRIYATGLSNGGGFVALLACNDTVGGEFGAFASVAGAYYPTSDPGLNGSCSPARDVTPILEFHGGGSLPPVTEWLGWWAERNGCDQTPGVEQLFDGKVQHYVWTCKGRSGVVQHYKSDAHKHNWPSTTLDFSAIASGDAPAEISASELIPAFFDMYYRPS